VRLSTFATSTLMSALKVLSTVLPDPMFFSFVRTTAPPLPGLWCWNQMTDQSCPSRLRTMPFLRSLVVAIRSACLSLGVSGRVLAADRARDAAGGATAQSSEPSGLSVVGPSVPSMETRGTTRPLRVVRPDETRETGDPADDDTEDYWARVQALRDDLSSLRPAN
jgi:hypothetical protein